jgi:nucleotide-binding universal stress UspA family protein
METVMGIPGKILVAVDGSDTSSNALKQSFKLTTDNSTLTVLSVSPHFHIDHPLSEVDNLNTILNNESIKILSEASSIAESEGVPITTMLKEGVIYTNIIETAEESGSDLVVIGRRGMTRIERALIGSDADRVVGHFKGCTLIVPRDSSLQFNSIIFAADGSEYSDNALDEAISYAKFYNSSLSILNAVNVADEIKALFPDAYKKVSARATEYLKGLKDEAERAGVNATIYLRIGPPYKVIVELAKELNAGLIIMGSHGRTGLKKIFMGSVTKRVIGYAPCPVMVVNKQDD